MKRSQYVIPQQLMAELMEVVSSACFIDDGDGDEMNNDEALAVDKALRRLIEEQDATEPAPSTFHKSDSAE